MSNIPDDRVYSQQHIWLQMETDAVAKIGITEFAQSELGDIVFVELPELNAECLLGHTCAVVESVKTASNINAPADGKIAEINEDLVDFPELINTAPYESGWICKIELGDSAAIDSLMNASQYESYIST